MSETLLYELHVKGMTKLHPEVPYEFRGTYQGLTHPSVLTHLKKIGVTAVSLMPVQQFVNDTFLQKRGLSNYWGYQTIGYFAPHNKYAVNEPVKEFKQMVKTLHENGLEVIVDVVYNHTAEGNHLGPTLSFRGIDNAAYYRLVENDKGYYFDTTGCGNSLLMRSPVVLAMILDSLRYWVKEMHVDGFRFDLATALTRQHDEADMWSAFLNMVHQDEVLNKVKLIAEPWDLGSNGYSVGKFPDSWAEWNGEYRDTVRDFWRGQEGTLPKFTTRIAGSSDIYAKPTSSINFITAHDGFTLRDLVSYNEKHNFANGEENRDGDTHNRSWNCGVEGISHDSNIELLRGRQQRNLLATLLLSQGVPMIAHGDELGRTQRGNNNAYCQDNELAWVHWNLTEEQSELLEFVSQLAEIRKNCPALRRGAHFESDSTEIEWLNDLGLPMSDWHSGHNKFIVARYNHDDASALVVFNAHSQPVNFTVPECNGDGWEVTVDTSISRVGNIIRSGNSFLVDGRSTLVLVSKRLKS